jgi:ferritin
VESVDALFQGEADGDGVAIKVVEKALALEKAISSDMQSLVELAEEQVGDPDLEEFVQDEGLAKQQERIFKLAAVVAQMKRVGTGKGLWHWDKELLEDQEKANA